MASGHDVFHAMYDQFRTSSTRSEQYVLDPGTGGTFNLRGRDRAYTSVGAGTYKLPDNVPIGVTFRIHATGSVAITTAAAVAVATLSSGQVVEVTPLSSTTWAIVNGGLADENSLYASSTVENALQENASLGFQFPNAKFNTTAAASPVTPAANILTGARHVYYQITTDGAFSLVTRTATQLYADLVQSTYNVPVGFSYQLTIVNRGNNTVTITAGSGITVTGELTLALLTTRTYVITFTSATTATMVSVSVGTIET